MAFYYQNKYLTSEELEAFADVLAHTKISISAEEATKAFHNMAQRLSSASDAWCSYSPGITIADTLNALAKSYDDLLRPETSARTDFPNENCLFYFLEENAYDEIKNIFDGGSSGELVPLDFDEKI